MPHSNALSITGDGILRVIPSDLQVSSPILDKKKGPEKTFKCKGIWDTGATGSVITQEVVDALGIKPVGMTRVNTASDTHMSPIYLVDFLFPETKLIVQGLRVTLGKLTDVHVLIGMDLITLGDFSITNKGGKTRMTFGLPSYLEVDYVRELDEIMAAPTMTRQQRRAAALAQLKKVGKKKSSQ